MSTSAIQVGELEVEIVRKPIRNLHLGVYPPDGRVRVAAPPKVSNDAIRVAVVSRLGWIKRHIRSFEAQPRQSERNYVSGETHYHLGKQYRLKLLERAGPSSVELRQSDWIEIRVPKGKDRDFRERVMQRWQRATLKKVSASLVSDWAERLGIPEPSLGVKRMKTKWGSCNAGDNRVWLNLELIKKPSECLNYVVLHEMAHLIEPNHGEQFVALLDRYMPNWRNLRDRLNSTPLRHEHWPHEAAIPVPLSER
jgi:hypothetical protein|tara:strand:- start:5223 stop:5978 length:756 start_codon:yes stop_codon:yes gene_type:complete